MKKIILLFLLGFSGIVHAVTPASVFSDNMVLQRDTPVRVWGTAEPGEAITVSFRGCQADTVAGKDGRWLVSLPALPASSQGETLEIRGRNTVAFENVLTGDIWLCVGQSNMQLDVFTIKNGREMAAKADHPSIRLLQIPLVWSRKPEMSVAAKWQLCVPETAGRFSGVAYLFGKELSETLRVPVGLINISWGGCRIEAMIAADTPAEVQVPEGVKRNYNNELADMAGKKDEELRKDKQRLASVLFNAMVHPLSPMAVKGMLWYQGEDNHTEGMEYSEKLKMLAHTWRKAFQQESLPIYLVLLPPFLYGQEKPLFLPRFRFAQQQFAESDPHAGFIVTSDCGDENDIHPRDKVPLAHRLAALALFKTYGIGGTESLAPTCSKIEFKGSTAVVTFANANGLKTRDGKPVSYLEIAGKDKIFHPASGVLSGERLFVSSPAVKEAAHVRFGWHKTANPNLVNRIGNPATPFSTCPLEL